MPIVPPTTTLQAIQTKVRRLTRSPSNSQLTDTDLQNYINTFVVYDFPEHLRTFNLRKTFTFYTNAYQDRYPIDEISFAGNTTNPLYNFQNLYITVHPPVYIAGFNSLFSQSREQFFGIYPKINNIQFTGSVGNGVTTSFAGVITNQTGPAIPNLNQPASGLLQGEVLFDSLTSSLQSVTLVDVPVVNPITGYNTVFGNLYNPSALPLTPPTVIDPNNNINYVTGAYTLDFGGGNAPGANQPVNSQTVPQIVSLPQALLFYDGNFIVRPIPDQSYRIEFEVYQRPVALLELNQSPELEEYWQLISYGAALKVFQDRMDIESVQLIMPEYKSQMNLCLRKTIVQYTNDRTATIYTDQVGNAGMYGSGFWFGGGQF